ncbi:hypothetical protein T552_00119 [Pneumocystis carinii B80]|uniref:Methyltransferase type 11 domain-containing protein n=1 Tax=Pneumocystis carinii (strain B80) TaxID=1408658 RepID=A0A0W4ZSZ6_PNEC8|nr:hypothetical protein T552_00119 [Pneumocystis carinii B80]KTW31476.1 hypothetical protein T552_00119 [Pneumocystis carinii B80]
MFFLSPYFHLHKKSHYFRFSLNKIYRLKTCLRSYVPFTVESSKKFLIFDQNVKKKQRLRAALDKIEAKRADYLKEEVAKRLVERLMFIKKKIKVIFDFGSGAGYIASYLSQEKNKNQFLGKIERLIMADVSEDIFDNDNLSNICDFIVEKVCIDNEIPSFSENSMDIVITNLYIHWINDLFNLFKQIKYILVPDGVFLGSMFGGDTLFELRTSLQLAEQERKGGIGARVSPMADIQDIGSLLSKVGFKLITIDVEDIIVDYPDIFSLMKDLQKMGENNAIMTRPHIISRDVLFAAEAIYREFYGNENGTLPCTFRVIYMIAWKPSPNQSLPLEKGSGKINLKDVL